MALSDKDIFLLGLHHGDGCLQKYSNSAGRLRFKYGSRNIEYPLWIKQEYCPNSKVVPCHDKGKVTYQVSSCRGIVDILTSCSYGLHKTVNIAVLKEAIKGRENLFLRGLLESDGSVSLYQTSAGNTTPRITWYSADYPELLQFLLGYLPNTASCKTYEQSKGAYGKKPVTQLYLTQVTKAFVETFFSPDIGYIFPKERLLRNCDYRRTYYKPRR